MARKKVKFALMININLREISLKKRRLGIVKKVRELTILCDVKACLIMFSSGEAEPMVWPSFEVARDLLEGYFALPDFIKKKKETNLESYLTEKTGRVQEDLKETQKKNMEYTIDQLMVRLSCGRKLDDHYCNEIYSLLSFSKDAIMHLRKRLDFVQYPPLRDPLMHPFKAQVQELRTPTYDFFVIGGGQEDETAWKTHEEVRKVNIGTVRETQSYYLMDQWIFPCFESPNPHVHQQIRMNMASYNETLDPRCYFPHRESYHPYQGSSSNGEHNLEMEPISPPVLALHGLDGSVSQPFQHHHGMNNVPTMAMSQPRQYSFDFMSREERSNIDNAGLHFHYNNNTMTTTSTNIGLRQEPPPLVNGVTAEESKVSVRSFDMNKDWSEINNQHF